MKTNDVYLNNASNTAYKVKEINNNLVTITRLDNTNSKELTIESLKTWCYIGNINEQNN